MRSRFSSRARRGLVILGALSMVAAACGSDSKTPTTGVPTTAAGASTTAATGASTGGSTAGTPAGSTAASTPGATTAGSTAGSTAGGASAGSAGCPPIDTSMDKTNGEGTGRFLSDIACADTKPLKAAGDPIVVGLQNPEGDPNGSFPEASLAAQAATDYINNELGGLGADIQNGKAGRPIKLEVCKMAISPDDSQRCANELATKKPTVVMSPINFFGNQFPVFAASKTPVIVGTPITIADFTTPGAYSIGAGGGCLGAHTALVYYATHQLKGTKIGIPWADTPPGVVCYYDLEAKPMDVLAGKVKSSSKEAGSIPDATYLGIPIKPATPDITAQVTQLLDYKPDVIIFSAQASDCWNLVAGLGRLGWTPDKIPLVLSGSCVDYDAAKAAGDLAKGIYFITGSGSLIDDPANIPDPRQKAEAINYQTKSKEFGLPTDQYTKGYATISWGMYMSLWEMTGEIARSGKDVDSATISDIYKATENQHSYGSTPLACAKAPQPYVAICNADVTVSQWNGTGLTEVAKRFTAIDLVAGTEIKAGP